MAAKPNGVILAGGRSSRMGAERKPLALLADEPMLAHVIKRLAPQVQNVFLSCEPGDDQLAGFDCAIVEDEVPRFRGPLAGLYSALLYMQRQKLEHGLMLCPCDAPFIPETVVDQLQAALVEVPAAVAVVSYEGVLQPTFSLWQSHHLSVVETAVLERGQGGLKHLISTLSHVVVDWPVSEPPPFYNINTPEQLVTANLWLAEHHN